MNWTVHKMSLLWTRRKNQIKNNALMILVHLALVVWLIWFGAQQFF